MTPDVNVLVAASRSDHPQYDIARDWLEDTIRNASGSKPLTIFPVVAVGLLRIVTHPRIFRSPTPGVHARNFLKDILSSPGVALASQGLEWPSLDALMEKYEAEGDIVTDLWIAATVIALNEHLVTFDRHFRRLLSSKRLTILRG